MYIYIYLYNVEQKNTFSPTNNPDSKILLWLEDISILKAMGYGIANPSEDQKDQLNPKEVVIIDLLNEPGNS